MNVLEVGGIYNSDKLEIYRNNFEPKTSNIPSNRNVETDNVSISDEAFKTLEEKNTIKEFSQKAYMMLKRRRVSEDDISKFKEIINKAEKVDDAKEYLKSLTANERDLVKRANSYGRLLKDFHIDKMSQEGARNMLKAPDSRSFVDFNNDGIVDHGVGKSFVFPPPNSPEKVKDAWDKTMEGLSEKEQLLASTMFMVQSIGANAKLDSQGKVVGFYTPWDKEYKNIFPTDQDEWFKFFDKIDSDLAIGKASARDPDQLKHIEKDINLMTNFRKNLINS